MDPQSRRESVTARSSSFRRASRLLVVLIVAAFGPYVSQSLGLRVEHLLIYGLLALAAVKIAARPRGYSVPPVLALVVACLVAATLWTLTVSALSANGVPALRVFAAAENYVQPIALIILITVFIAGTSPVERRRLLQRACATACVLLTINSVVAVLTVFVDTWPAAQYFVRAHTDTGLSVWQTAATMGRYSGVFNQPLEAGLGYSIGLAAWVYWTTASRRTTGWRWLLLGGLLIGGALSVSKVFLLGGVPLFALYAVWATGLHARLWPRTVLAAMAFALLLVPTGMWLLTRWAGRDYLLRLFDPGQLSDQGLIALYTAGRLGAGESTVKRLFRETLEEAPVEGFGFGAASPLDSGYIEFLYQGGTVALVLYLLAVGALGAHTWISFRRARDEMRLLAVLLLITLGAGIGAPVLTANRSCILLWIFIVLAIGVSVSGTRSPAGDVRRSATAAPGTG